MYLNVSNLVLNYHFMLLFFFLSHFLRLIFNNFFNMQIFSTKFFVLTAILVLISVNCLTIHHNKRVEHFAKVIQESISHQLVELFHLRRSWVRLNVLQSQVMAFILSDQEIVGEIMAKGAISQKIVKKIKKFIVGNDKIINSIYYQFNQNLPKDNCLIKIYLTQDKRKKLISVILDAMDLQDIFDQYYHMGGNLYVAPDEGQKIRAAIEAEPTLGEEVLKCVKYAYNY